MDENTNVICEAEGCNRTMTLWDIYCEDHTHITTDRITVSTTSEVWA